ncbi:hypothetical protein EK21DRAFT_91480 [Setomelanomma holmii]|uniref:Uncharacterized protein n=1 Tax=Setomelanomma holmii TaxID=210430 RepID=A0A9P4LJP8_9PLEO|nr:hypothetical protein EK21DRAFT_91480 [Setomelanomma holmii]
MAAHFTTLRQRESGSFRITRLDTPRVTSISAHAVLRLLKPHVEMPKRERFVPIDKTHNLYLENFRAGLPTSIFNIKGMKDNGRELTLFEDRPPALAGIVSELQTFWNDTYLADLPAEPYRSPGWSWASSRGCILFSRMVKDDAKFVSCTVIPVDKGSPVGRVKSGQLTPRVALKSVPPSLDPRYLSMDLGPNGRRIIDRDSRLLLLGYGQRGFARCLMVAPVGCMVSTAVLLDLTGRQYLPKP